MEESNQGHSRPNGPTLDLKIKLLEETNDFLQAKVNRQGRLIAHLCDVMVANREQANGLTALLFDYLRKFIFDEAEIMKKRIESYKAGQ